MGVMRRLPVGEPLCDLAGSLIQLLVIRARHKEDEGELSVKERLQLKKQSTIQRTHWSGVREGIREVLIVLIVRMVMTTRMMEIHARSDRDDGDDDDEDEAACAHEPTFLSD